MNRHDFIKSFAFFGSDVFQSEDRATISIRNIKDGVSFVDIRDMAKFFGTDDITIESDTIENFTGCGCCPPNVSAVVHIHIRGITTNV